MRSLSIDIETYSGVDLAKCGVYPYAKSSDFEILLFGYAFGNETVRVVDLKSGERFPEEVYNALTDPKVVKTAYNANFERTCIGTFFKISLPPEQWSCTMVQAMSLGLPVDLKGVAELLNLKNQKLQEGKELIKFFSIPLKGKGARNLPGDNPDKWDKFKAYCIRDVEVERKIRKRLKNYQIIEKEQEIWCLDQRINDRGIMADRSLISNALACAAKYEEKLVEEAKLLTGVKNPKSPAQIKKWLHEKAGLEIESLSKERVLELLQETSEESIKRVLEIRQELSKTSIKKYEAMERALCKDERLRGLLQFYGASRTGRWAGRLVQVHNLPQIKIKDIGLARSLLKAGDYETLELLYGSIPEVLSELVRTSLIPSKDSYIIAADFSAIEARVLAWLADEGWRMEVFKTHGRIYEAGASRMFKVPIESITKGHPLRQKGKVAELALGYQGGKGALLSMGALKMGLREEELPNIIAAWRDSNPNIVNLWAETEKAAIKAVKNRITAKLPQGIELYCEGDILFIKLPSGRCLTYIRPRLETDEIFQKPALTYEGPLQATKKWGRLKTYGGKLVENIVQAISRDILSETMLNLEKAGYPIVMHIHDEVVLDVPNNFGSLQEVLNLMSAPILWAPGLPLKAEAFQGAYYRKE